MSKNKRAHKDSRDAKVEASKLVKSLNLKGENKEQTRQIIQGVQRAIEAYMRQQGAKTRELDKKVKKVNKMQVSLEQEKESLTEDAVDSVVYQQSKLAWGLFALSTTALFIAVLALVMQWACTP